jgi:hypothetical protein
MAAYAKTDAQGLLAIAQVASNAVTKSSELDVSTKIAASLFMRLGRDDVGGALAVPFNFRVQISPDASGDRRWHDLAVFQSQLTVPEAEAITGTQSAGATTLTVASTTNFAIGQLFLLKNTTIANSEFGRIKSFVANTSFTPIDAITSAQTSSTFYNQAEEFILQVDCAAIKRIRVVCDNSGTGRSVVCEVFAITGDSFA